MILGYAFVPRIRDLPSKRLYVFERAGVPKRLRPLVGGVELGRVRLFFVEYFSPISRAFLTTDEPSPVRFRGDGFRPAAHRDGPPAFFGCPTPPGPRPPGA